MTYEFDVDGKIIGKERPRVNTNTGFIYTPNKTKDYEFYIEQCFKVKYPNFEQIEGRVSVEIIAYWAIPKSTSKKTKEQTLKGEISPTKKPDVDNIAKSILDAMNNFVFKDDTQVTKISITKLYSEQEFVHIKVIEY